MQRLVVLAFFAPGVIVLGWRRGLFPAPSKPATARSILGYVEPMLVSGGDTAIPIGPWTTLMCCAFWLLALDFFVLRWL